MPVDDHDFIDAIVELRVAMNLLGRTGRPKGAPSKHDMRLQEAISTVDLLLLDLGVYHPVESAASIHIKRVRHEQRTGVPPRSPS
jgi:hypothetical protein